MSNAQAIIHKNNKYYQTDWDSFDTSNIPFIHLASIQTQSPEMISTH